MLKRKLMESVNIEDKHEQDINPIDGFVQTLIEIANSQTNHEEILEMLKEERKNIEKTIEMLMQEQELENFQIGSATLSLRKDRTNLKIEVDSIGEVLYHIIKHCSEEERRRFLTVNKKELIKHYKATGEIIAGCKKIEGKEGKFKLKLIIEEDTND